MFDQLNIVFSEIITIPYNYLLDCSIFWSLRYTFRYFSNGTNYIEMELTQCLVFFVVNPSPKNTCPRCPPQLAHTISVRMPSGSGIRLTAPFISSSKLGHPQCDSNLSSER